jgi:hypothetical protein
MDNLITVKTSRREVLLSAASVGVLAATGSFAALASEGKGNAADKATNDDKNLADAWLSHADETFFSPHINSHFEFWDARGRAGATLSAARGFAAGRKFTQAVPAFTLDFIVQESTRVEPSELCFVTHAKLGTFELFVVPVSGAKGERMLVATFARLMAPASGA